MKFYKADIQRKRRSFSTIFIAAGEKWVPHPLNIDLDRAVSETIKEDEWEDDDIESDCLEFVSDFKEITEEEANQYVVFDVAKVGKS